MTRDHLKLIQSAADHHGGLSLPDDPDRPELVDEAVTRLAQGRESTNPGTETETIPLDSGGQITIRAADPWDIDTDQRENTIRVHMWNERRQRTVELSVFIPDATITDYKTSRFVNPGMVR